MSYPNKQYINGKLIYSEYTSQFQKIYTYDWFCGPGSQINTAFMFCILKKLEKNHCDSRPMVPDWWAQVFFVGSRGLMVRESDS